MLMLKLKADLFSDSKPKTRNKSLSLWIELSKWSPLLP